MAKQSYADHLSAVPLFAACSKKELQKIAKATDEITLPAGHVLMEQGQLGREAFVIVDGTATVKRNGRKIAELGPGSAVGELSLLDRGERTATVEAETELTVLVIGPREFGAVIDSVPSLTGKLLQSMATTIRDLDSKVYG
ncbi:MAG TPA: cyclic nucleotide-binding domain-containing protein [Acidimicrobiales bacterium]|nr:cyclic nucleotide-binding domain-containing protein [Acidimicrobiales bacterium]